MIHYHGTPFGSTRQDAARFFIGKHALVPYPRPEDMPIVADVCQSFVLDNGAYTIWKQGGEMDYSGYLDFVETWHKHPGFDWAIIPDVIEGTAAQNDKFLEMWPSNMKGIPVYHNYFPIERLKKMADKYEVVALGSSGKYSEIDSPIWWARMAEMMKAICDNKGRPACKLHGLRMMNPRVFEHIPLSSADSTNVVQNSCQIKRFGMYPAPTASQRARVLAEKVEHFNSAPVWIKEPEQVNLFDVLLNA